MFQPLSIGVAAATSVSYLPAPMDNTCLNFRSYGINLVTKPLLNFFFIKLITVLCVTAEDSAALISKHSTDLEFVPGLSELL